MCLAHIELLCAVAGVIYSGETEVGAGKRLL